MSPTSLAGTWTLRLATARGTVPHRTQLQKGIPAVVPGTVHVALQQAGIIPDPYVDRNELAVQWVDAQDWEWERTLVASAEECARARQELLFQGIDTVATVRLNGKVLARSRSMFRSLSCDCRGVLRPGRNTLRVRIDSPTRAAAAEARRSGGRVRADDFVWQTGERRPTWRTGLRKVQCHFGWDWGTYLATSGIHLPAALACSDRARIAQVSIQQRHEGPVGAPRRVQLTVRVAIASPRREVGQLVATLMGGHMPHDDRRERKVIAAARSATIRRGRDEVALTLTVDEPVLWWPAGEGTPYLYFLSVHWDGAEGGRTSDHLVKVGLRTIAVETTADADPQGQPATGFRIVVNGRPIFAKGANWIPVDQFVEHCTPGRYRHLLESMVACHMNMVRVWGGGWYEQDLFYDLCDELGILVWQDIMMACGFYPDHPRFLAELREEVREQVGRLARHACIALWCGDNEDNTGVAHWWKDAGPLPRRLARYRRVLRVVGAAVRAADPSRRFWPSSPCNGAIDEHPDDPRHGDVHYWNVWHGRQPFSNYRTVRPRFVSEFGFQSFPEERTLAPYVPAAEMNPSSRVMEHHQRSNDGNLLITNTMAREMRIPKDFPSFCWVSQINQAMAIKTAVEHWRRLKPWCMGTLYWQLNDLWPVASWSSIDWAGRWKVLHHEAARFFAPLLPSLVVEDGALAVWATSDLPQALDLEARLRLVATDGRTWPIRTLRVRLAAQESRQLARLPLTRLLPTGVEAHEVLAELRLTPRGTDVPAALAGGAAGSTPLVPWKWLALQAPRLHHRLAPQDGQLTLTLTAENPVPFVHATLEGLEGHFQGDWPVLLPGAPRQLRWVPHAALGARPPSFAEARRRLRILSLWDTFDHPRTRARA